MKMSVWFYTVFLFFLAHRFALASIDSLVTPSEIGSQDIDVRRCITNDGLSVEMAENKKSSDSHISIIENEGKEILLSRFGRQINRVVDLDHIYFRFEATDSLNADFAVIVLQRSSSRLGWLYLLTDDERSIRELYCQ